MAIFYTKCHLDSRVIRTGNESVAHEISPVGENDRHPSGAGPCDNHAETAEKSCLFAGPGSYPKPVRGLLYSAGDPTRDLCMIVAGERIWRRGRRCQLSGIIPFAKERAPVRITIAKAPDRFSPRVASPGRPSDQTGPRKAMASFLIALVSGSEHISPTKRKSSPPNGGHCMSNRLHPQFASRFDISRYRLRYISRLAHAS